MLIYLRFFLLAMLLSTSMLTAQIQNGAAMTLDFSTGSGKWTAYDRVIQEYYQAYPWLTDTSQLRNNKFGISIGFTDVQERTLFGFRFGGFKTTCWAAGLAPTGEQWNETILVKCQSTDLFAGIFFIRGEWFRMGITGGFSLNFAKMKSVKSDKLIEKAKSNSGLVFISPGSATNRENKMFCSLKFSLPIAIGRKHALCVEPFYSLPLWKVNTSEIRNEMIPNSTPAQEKNYYKGWMPYYGVRISICIGFRL